MMPAPLPSIRLVLADDHDFVRAGVRALLSTIPGVQVVGEARSGTELVAAVESLRPDVVVTDISMPGMDGIEAVGRIKERFPAVCALVLVLSMHESADAVRRAVSNGACGYLRKDAPQFELEQALRSIVAGGTYFGSGVAQLLLQQPEPAVEDQLTERQVQILRMLAEGKSSKEIGFELGLSSKTVNVHRANIMERLRITDMASLARYAVRKGLVKP